MSIAVIFGGRSFEHEISIVSAIAMKKVLKNELIYIFIDKNRDFYLIPTDIIKSNIFSSGNYKKYNQLNLTTNGFEIKKIFGSKFIKFDVALNLVHGADGEDGTLAGVFKFFNIPFIGPRVEASAISCNKYLTKSYLNSCNVNAIDFKYFNKNDDIKIDNYPVIIKPIRLGSSIGISIVKSQDELSYALDVAFEFDNEIIIEPFYQAIKEYNLAGTKIDNKFIFSIIEEPQKDEFLDFEKKYLDFNRTNSISKANIDNKLKQELQNCFKKVYNTLFDGAIIRCDFFVLNNKVYINEINPIPGSMSNYLFDNFNDIFNELTFSLPKNKTIAINYDYVNKIQNAKGKI
jgi:D-alanine-D-alanine ligase